MGLSPALFGGSGSPTARIDQAANEPRRKARQCRPILPLGVLPASGGSSEPVSDEQGGLGSGGQVAGGQPADRSHGEQGGHVAEGANENRSDSYLSRLAECSGSGAGTKRVPKR